MLSITTPKGKLYLTIEQQKEIRNQIRISDAKDVLLGFDVNPEKYSDEELLELAKKLENEIYYFNTGELEFQLLYDNGYIKDEEER